MRLISNGLGLDKKKMLEFVLKFLAPRLLYPTASW